MWDDDSITRRRIVTASAGAATVSVLAGCMGGNEDGDGGGDGGDGDDGGDGEDEPDPADWEDVEEVRFEAYTEGWEGLEPSVIEGEQNPTILLFEGETYTLAWESGDSGSHNIEIRDEDDEVVDDLATEEESGDDVEQELEIEAVTDEMAEYVCAPHEGTMRGEIVVESEDGEDAEDGEGDGSESMDGNETDGNDTDGNDSDGEDMNGNDTDGNDSDDGL